MKTYTVLIIEKLQREVEVEATGAAEALILVTDAYKKGDHVLDYSDFKDVEIKTKPNVRSRGMER